MPRVPTVIPEPMLARLTDRLPTGTAWSYEVKWDGYRWQFVRASDHKHFACELRFHGESYGWEAQILENGDLLYSHGALSRARSRCSGLSRSERC